MTRDAAVRMGVASSAGVLVGWVDPESPAATAGVLAGDVIVSVNDRPVETPERFAEALATADSRRGVVLNLFRNGKRTFVLLQPEE